MAWLRSLFVAVLALALAGFVSPVSRASAEPLLVTLEGAGSLAISSPQADEFGPGGALSLGILYPVAPAFLIGLRLRSMLLTNGDAPSTPGLKDQGTGALHTASLVVRLRPFAGSDGVRRATGLFLDAAIGGGATGDLKRPSFEGGLGYGFGLDGWGIAPVLRYVQVVQPSETLGGNDARILTLGAEFTFFDAMPVKETAPPTVMHEPSDRDGDGISDLHDSCPDSPEDFDGHDDADGCPDPDNDKDGILDAKDKCPDQAEDFDKFEDTDGCPDPDNDKDGFLDPDDQCPDEAEVVNGNKDYDGCPDEGLIEFKDDRVVLEERVLFDFERARVKREARPVLRAIVNLKSQHPDWIKMRVEGHADARGDAQFNQELSEHRAANVMKELIKLGIPAAQIESAGFGATRLRDKRQDEEAHARNRRVEFVVMERGQAPAVLPTPAIDPNAVEPDDAADSDDEADEPPAPPKTAAPAEKSGKP